jgi:hypothetical protein
MLIVIFEGLSIPPGMHVPIVETNPLVLIENPHALILIALMSISGGDSVLLLAPIRQDCGGFQNNRCG